MTSDNDERQAHNPGSTIQPELTINAESGATIFSSTRDPVPAIQPELASASIETKITRQVWFIGALMLLVQVALIALVILFLPPTVLEAAQGDGQASPDTSSFLPVAGTLIGVAVVFLMGFLGLKRLEQFDGEISALRRELSEGMRSERQFFLEDIDRQQKALSARHDEFVLSFQARAANAVAAEVAKYETELSMHAADYDEKVGARIQEIENSLQPYAWLSERSDEVDSLGGIRTVGAAHDRITNLMYAGKVDIAIRISEYVIKNDLAGGANDFHNMSTELSRHDLHDLAASVAMMGTRRFPTNVDLVADLINLLVEQGKLQEAESAAGTLRSLPVETWNWRAFAFLSEFLLASGNEVGARQVWRDFRQYLPGDERGYSVEGSHLLEAGKLTECIALMTEALDSYRHVPQSASILTRAQLALGNYQEALTAAERAVESSYDEQDRVDQQAIIFHRAAAQDGLLHQMIEMRDIHGPQFAHVVRGCLADYRLVQDLKSSIRYFRDKAEQRIRIITADLERAGVSPRDIGVEIEPQTTEGLSPPESEVDLAKLLNDASHGDAAARAAVAAITASMEENGMEGLARSITSIAEGERDQEVLGRDLDGVQKMYLTHLLSQLN